MADAWFDILQVAKILSKDGESFSAEQLAESAKIAAGPKSDAKKMAYGWISKFLKWGYIKRTLVLKQEKVRDTQGYTVTKSGFECVVRAGKNDRIQELEDAVDMLLGVIQDFAIKRKTKEGEASFEAMISMAQEIISARTPAPEAPPMETSL